MDVTSSEPDSSEVRNDDRHPLLPEQMERHESRDHIVDICGDRDASSSSSSRDPPGTGTGTGTSSLPAQQADISPNGGPTYQAAPLGVRARRSGGDGYSRRRRSPLNSGLWISVELVVTVSQVVASIVVLSVSRNENPQAPLFAWVVGYASGCVAMLPVLYWRYRNRNRDSQQDSTDQDSSQSVNPAPETSLSYTAISGNQASDEESNQASVTATMRNTQPTGFLSARHNNLVDHFKMALDCFFAVWFVVGNVWIFGGHSSPSDAPKLYRLCIVFLTFSCIGYAMPFILCATICCCLPCIISVLGIREDFSQTRGATAESINLLPTYKFKLKKTGNSSSEEPDPEVAEGGILAAGTEKEREITGEDAACCICLARYAENDELRELPCTHLFHVDCVDKWLKINASCPLCKAELGEDNPSSPSH